MKVRHSLKGVRDGSALAALNLLVKDTRLIINGGHVPVAIAFRLAKQTLDEDFTLALFTSVQT